jgi:hypothetical protein
MCRRFNHRSRVVPLLGLLTLALAGPAAATGTVSWQVLPVQHAFPNANLQLQGLALALLYTQPVEPSPNPNELPTPCFNVATYLSLQGVSAVETLPDGKQVRYYATGLIRHQAADVPAEQSFSFEAEVRYVDLRSQRSFLLHVQVTVLVHPDGTAQVALAFLPQPCF